MALLNEVSNGRGWNSPVEVDEDATPEGSELTEADVEAAILAIYEIDEDLAMWMLAAVDPRMFLKK